MVPNFRQNLTPNNQSYFKLTPSEEKCISTYERTKSDFYVTTTYPHQIEISLIAFGNSVDVFKSIPANVKSPCGAYLYPQWCIRPQVRLPCIRKTQFPVNCVRIQIQSNRIFRNKLQSWQKHMFMYCIGFCIPIIVFVCRSSAIPGVHRTSVSTDPIYCFPVAIIITIVFRSPGESRVYLFIGDLICTLWDCVRILHSGDST